MANAVCGCECQREREGVWRIVDAAADCALRHQLGQRGVEQGEPSPLDGIGACVTVLFERCSRTAMLVTPRDSLVGLAPARAAPRRSR